MEQFRVWFLNIVVYEPQLWLMRHCKPFHQFGQQFLPMDFAPCADVNLPVRQIKAWLNLSASLLAESCALDCVKLLR